jgi:hypothetical protein
LPLLPIEFCKLANIFAYGCLRDKSNCCLWNASPQ